MWKKEPVSAESIARMADKGQGVSRFFSNSGEMRKPIQLVNVDFTASMLRRTGQRRQRAERQQAGGHQDIHSPRIGLEPEGESVSPQRKTLLTSTMRIRKWKFENRKTKSRHDISCPNAELSRASDHERVRPPINLQPWRATGRIRWRWELRQGRGGCGEGLAIGGRRRRKEGRRRRKPRRRFHRRRRPFPIR